MSEFVVYKDPDGWFRWVTAKWWDNVVRPHSVRGDPMLVMEEVGRYPTSREARAVRDLYNQMVHGKPSNNELYNRALAQRSNDETTD